jgi:MFS family permease
MQPVQREGLFAPSRRALTIGLVLTVTLVAFEALAVVTILPVIKDDLGGLRLYGWVTSAFFLGTLIGIVVAGAESDRRGPGPPYLFGVALFCAGLAIAGLAPNMLVLVLARALQGIGGGAIPATAYASIGRSYPESLRPRVFAVLSTAWVAPALVGPALSALVATHLSWRYVFLGLLPLVVLAAGLALPVVWRIGPPPQPNAQAPRLLDAVRVAAGSALLLAGLAGGSIPLGLALVVGGLLVGVRPLLRLVPPGTLRARRGLPMAVLSRGLLTFAFFGTDTYVPLAITAVRGRSPAVASLAVTATTLTWTLGSWAQERASRAWSSRRFVRAGLAVVTLGIGVFALSLLEAVPFAVAIAGWAIAGLGIGLAYSRISLMVLGLARTSEQGRASAQLQLFDTLGSALGAGLGGVLIAVGSAADWHQATGLAAAFAMTGAASLAAVLLTRRLPEQRLGTSSAVPATTRAEPADQEDEAQPVELDRGSGGAMAREPLPRPRHRGP